MKYLLALLMLFASPAWAGYVEVSKSNTGEIFLIDFETLRREGNRVKFWQMVNYPEPRTLDKVAYSSFRSRNEYDCKQQQRRLLVATFFTGQDANGDAVFDDRTAAEWRDIAPGSVLWAIMKLVCSK
jgi:hypothetical protein